MSDLNDASTTDFERHYPVFFRSNWDFASERREKISTKFRVFSRKWEFATRIDLWLVLQLNRHPAALSLLLSDGLRKLERERLRFDLYIRRKSANKHRICIYVHAL